LTHIASLVHNAHAEQTHSGASSVGGHKFAHPPCVRARAVVLLIGMKQAQRQEWEEILPLGHRTRPARQKRTAKRVCGRCDAVELRVHKEGGVGEVRRSKCVTEYDLAPRFEILQGCSQLGVKYGQTLG
jgi:hypothetical protein